MAPSDIAWTAAYPAVFDIVSCWFPERLAPRQPGSKLRPGLVTAILQNQRTGEKRVRVSYGTSVLKFPTRGHLDLFIQNSDHVSQFGLGRATRFDLDFHAVLPWTPEFFGCWTGYSSPVISRLTEEYVRQYAYIMMNRGFKS